MLALLPHGQQFLTAEAKERIQYETSPHALGNVLGNLYSSEQRREMAYALLQLEEGYMENPEATISEVANDLADRARRLDSGFETLVNVDRIRRQLFSKLKDSTSQVNQTTGIGGTVSLTDFAEWIAAQESTSTGLPVLPKLFRAFLSERDAIAALDAYETELTTAMRDISDPETEHWSLNLRDPTTEDFQAHLRALDRLEDRFVNAVEQYWEDRRIVVRDRLLAAATEIIQTNLQQKHDREILSWVPCDTSTGEWTRYHTRRANQLVDRAFPVLTSQSKPGNNTEYALTAFGQFVKALWMYNGAEIPEAQETYNGDLTSFSTTLGLSQDVVETALNEIERAHA